MGEGLHHRRAGTPARSLRGGAAGIVTRLGEWLCYVSGFTLTGVFLSQLALGEVQRQSGIASFQAHMATAEQRRQPSLALDELAPPDTRLWSPQRIADYQASLQAELPSVLGVLAAPALGLEVPVYPTDSQLSLDRGAGIIDGMAYPHELGNIGVAGHRDGYFRTLKDISPGDELVLQTLVGTKHFTVERTEIVEATDTRVLADTDQQTLTLVTCYPFYYVGHAPQRFVVIARLDARYVRQPQGE